MLETVIYCDEPVEVVIERLNAQVSPVYSHKHLYLGSTIVNNEFDWTLAWTKKCSYKLVGKIIYNYSKEKTEIHLKLINRVSLNIIKPAFIIFSILCIIFRQYPFAIMFIAFLIINPLVLKNNLKMQAEKMYQVAKGDKVSVL